MAQKSIKEYVFRKALSSRIPVSGTFELTSRCNLDCKMCYVRMSPEEQELTGKELTKEEWISFGRSAVENGMIYLLLTGGEPLLRPDFLEIYTSMVRMGVIVSVNTNGTLITPQIVECFKKYRPEKVNITLYGDSACTYEELCGNANGFEKALHGIKMLRQAGIPVTINTTFTKLNVADMEKLVSFAREEEIAIRMAAFIFPPVRNGRDKEYDVYLSPEEQGYYGAKFDKLTMSSEEIEKRKLYIKETLEGDEESDFAMEGVICEPSNCMAGKGAFWISWDGFMLPCGMLSDYSIDIREKSFENAWEEINGQIKQVFLPAECTGCKYKKICPSCAAVSQSMNGISSQVPKEMCIRTKAYIDELMKDE